MHQNEIAKRRAERKAQKRLQRRDWLDRKPCWVMLPHGILSKFAISRATESGTKWRGVLARSIQVTIMFALCGIGLFGLSVPACGGEKPRPLSFREQSVEITSVPQDSVFYLNDIQGSPLAEADPAGQILGAVAYHPYGAVRHQTGHHGDPWGFVGNEEDRGSGISDFQARPYRPELGILGSVDPQALLRPEKIMGQPSRMFPYAYSAGDPVSHFDKDGRDYKFSVEGTHITITLPVVFYGKVTQQDVDSMKNSFEGVWNQSPRTYKFDPKGPEYDVRFKLEGVIAKESERAVPASKEVNSVSIVRGRYLDGPNGKNIGGADCQHGVGCRTGSFPSERLKDKTVIAHELGHLMGLDHVDDERNIMHRTNDGPKDKNVWQTQINQIANRGMMTKPDNASTYERMIDTEPPPSDGPK